ncbi:hypothetical protein [Dokdonia sp. Asnod2-E02]|uniref:hypothetical protein n=1 Tax=Dokdonia sp. Asnod2-E02 TaxID=3160574 RepID=UPI00386C116E
MKFKEESNKELSTSLKETISSSELSGIGTEIAEITIDSIMNEGVLRDFPIVGALVGVWKTGVAINDHRFLRKMLLFLSESSKLSDEARKDIIEKLDEEDYQAESGEKLIAIIDKLETGSKSILLGRALALFGNKIINKDEFWRVSFIIERLPMSDIIALKEWKETDLNKVFDIRKHLYLSVGIGWFVLNASSTGFCWQERLCEIFAEHLLE